MVYLDNIPQEILYSFKSDGMINKRLKRRIDLDKKDNFIKLFNDLSEKNKDSVLQFLESFTSEEIESFIKVLPLKKKRKAYRSKGIAIASIVSLTLLFTTFFGGVVFSKEFRHTVFNVLEGDGKFSVTTIFADQALSAEELSTVMRPIALDGQGYSVLASGDLQHNYTLVYQKNGEEIVFDVQRGMTQAYFDSDHATWSQSSVNGQPAYFCEQKSRNTISVFMQGGLVCTVSGSMGETRLIRLASSISIR